MNPKQVQNSCGVDISLHQGTRGVVVILVHAGITEEQLVCMFEMLARLANPADKEFNCVISVVKVGKLGPGLMNKGNERLKDLGDNYGHMLVVTRNPLALPFLRVFRRRLEGKYQVKFSEHRTLEEALEAAAAIAG